MANAVNWFEIPVTNVSRAVEFYGTVLGEALDTMDGPDGPMHVFPGEQGPVGALFPVDAAPVSGGVLLYLHSPDIDAALGRVAGAGGEVLAEKAPIGPFGWIGRFQDSEGNIVALHTPAA